MNTNPECCLSRRSFIHKAGLTAAAGSVACSSPATDTPSPELREMTFYDKLDDLKIQCLLCPQQCTVENGKRGECGAHENRNGQYYSLVYGRPVAINNDPIEKKPFFHVYPGSKAFSIATVGCNIHCKFCQNWEISQAKPESMKVPFRSPKEIVKLAKQYKSKTIAYTYNEPTVFYEYMVDCAKEAKEQEIGSVVISNGYISEEPLKKMIPLMTAIKIDLKAFSQQFYGRICGGRLKPVLKTLEILSKSDVWFEIVVLVIPTLNDDMDEIKRMAEWIVKKLGPNVPVHFTRFHPQYKIKNLQPTPPKTLFKARETAIAQGCNFVYGGNMPGIPGENTYCPNPKCKTMIIDRHGHGIVSDELKKGKCHKCGNKIPGVWA